MDAVPIEVEHKFLLPDDIESRLLAINAELASNHTFTDVYLDTPQNSLALADTWLRLRNGKYQLKYNPPMRVNSAAQQYSETSEESIIQQQVAIVLGTDCCDVDLEKLVPFATITTHRAEYKLDNVVIDLDKTDFGYNIGEVEVICNSSNDLQSATEAINRVISSLGVQTVGKVKAKLLSYLDIYNKELCNKIVLKLGLQ